MKKLVRAVVIVSLCGLCRGADELFELKQVVEGVYAAIAKPAYKINSNAAVIVLDEGVLVVDTHSKPSAARGLIEQIKKVTNKPVKWVVDTHFHWDHFQGNAAYPNAWPSGLEIISSEVTRHSIEQRGIPRVKNQILSVPKEIEQLKADRAKATSSAERAAVEENLRQAEAYLAELKSMEVSLPTLTLERSLILYRKSRTVQILWMGRGHTDGDVVVYLPKDKVLVTGDLLQGWMPYMGDSYPYDWVETLDRVADLDFGYVIGGHGDVMRDKEQFKLWKTYLADLLSETAGAYAEGKSMTQTVETLTAGLKPRYASRFPPGIFERSIVGNIQKAYRVVSGSQE